MCPRVFLKLQINILIPLSKFPLLYSCLSKWYLCSSSCSDQETWNNLDNSPYLWKMYLKKYVHDLIISHFSPVQSNHQQLCFLWSALFFFGKLVNTWCPRLNCAAPSPPKASLVAQLVKNLPAMRETWVQSLDWNDLLERGNATHSSILA